MIFLIIIGIILLIGILSAVNSYCLEKERRDRLCKKYGQNEIAKKIINKIIWVGETVEQLKDSLGAPLDVDESVLKTKVKEVWKYYRKGVNRYGLKIKVENKVVIGWDEKL